MRRRRHGAEERVLLPFGVRAGVPEPALERVLAFAAGGRALLVPCALLVVPRRLAPDAPLPRQAERATALLDELELHAGAAGVPVDGRMERGRSLRHALAGALAAEPADRVLLAGWEGAEVAWALDHLAPEVVVLRPALAPPVASGA